MIHRLAACVWLSALLGACGEAEPSSPPAPPEVTTPDTAAEVRALIDAEGPQATWAVLTGPEGDATGPLFDGIGTGEAAWLALVPDLQPASDGWFAEGLQEALYVALPNNAPGVLALMPDYGSLEFVCRPVGDLPTPEQTAANQAAITAVEAITDPALAEARTECLAGLRG